jgi:hypothetical protein
VIDNFDSVEAMQQRPFTSFQDVVRLAAAVAREYRGFSAGGDTALEMGDEVLAWNLFFVDDMMRQMEYRRAVREGDTGSMWVVYRRWLYAFRACGMKNYAGLVLDMFVQFRKELTPDMRKMHEATWLVNLSGRADGFIGSDLALECDIGQGKVRLSPT